MVFKKEIIYKVKKNNLYITYNYKYYQIKFIGLFCYMSYYINIIIYTIDVTVFDRKVLGVVIKFFYYKICNLNIKVAVRY